MGVLQQVKSFRRRYLFVDESSGTPKSMTFAPTAFRLDNAVRISPGASEGWGAKSATMNTARIAIAIRLNLIRSLYMVYACLKLLCNDGIGYEKSKKVKKPCDPQCLSMGLVIRSSDRSVA